MFICLFLFQGQAKVPSKPDWPNTAVIAGGVLGSITIVVLVFLYCYWKKNSKYEDAHFYTWNIPGWKMCKQIHEFLFYFIFQKSKQQHLGTTYGSKLMLFLHKKKKKPYYCWHLQFIVTFVPLERCSHLTIARKAKNHEVGPQDGFSTFKNKHLSELLHLWQISLNDRNPSFLVCAHALVFVQHEACQGLRFEQWMLWTWTCVI